MINLRIIPNIDVSSCFRAIKLRTVPLGKTTVVFKIDLGLILRRWYVSDAALVLAHVHFLKISGLPRQLSHFFLPVVKRGHLLQIFIVDIHGGTWFSQEVIFEFFAKSFPIKFVSCVRVPKSWNISWVFVRFCHKSGTQNFWLSLFETFQLGNKRWLFLDKRGHWVACDWGARDQRRGRDVVLRRTYYVLLRTTYQTLKFNHLSFVLHVFVHVDQVLRKPSVFLQVICILLYDASCQSILLDVRWSILFICLVCWWIHLHRWTGWSEHAFPGRPVMESYHILILLFLTGFFCCFNYWIRISLWKWQVFVCIFKIGDVRISLSVFTFLFIAYWSKCCFPCFFYWNSTRRCDIWQGVGVLVTSWPHIQRGYWIDLIELLHESIQWPSFSLKMWVSYEFWFIYLFFCIDLCWTCRFDKFTCWRGSKSWNNLFVRIRI